MYPPLVLTSGGQEQNEVIFSDNVYLTMGHADIQADIPPITPTATEPDYTR